MATLGKAYVQIVPSADGISGSITNLLGGETESAGKQAGENFGSKLVSMAKKVIAAAGIGKAIQASLNEGGALQQSLGGVETLFKENADAVKNYASQAFRTTGLSANEYMENVTGFSASLLQSLGGDTAKAAEIANTAMVDMADNSNKMGTSMEAIQNAYSGFAKQNYTMLDNLKLGYGGTKTEMQRLLKDAQKLTGVKYDINNLSDVYEAIHAIQGEMGITGTTAKEASETLQGSFAAMKASFTDLLGNLSLGNDITPQLKALAQTTSTWLFGNFIPMVGNILKNIPTLIVGIFQEGVPLIMEEGGKMLTSFQEGFLANLPSMTESAMQLLLSFSEGLLTGSESMITSGSNLIQSILTGIMSAVPVLLEYIPQIIGNIGVMFATALPTLIQTGMDMITNLASGIWNNRGQIFEYFTNIFNEGVRIVSSIDWIGLGMDVIHWVVDGVQNLFDAIPDLLHDIGDFANNTFGSIDWAGLGSSVVDFIVQGISYLFENIPSLLESIGNAAVAVVTEIDWVGLGTSVIDFISSGISELFNDIPDLLEQIGNSARDLVTGIDWWGLGSDIVNGIINGIKSMGSTLWSALTGIANDALNAAKRFLKIGSPSKVFEDEVGVEIPAGTAVGVVKNSDVLTDAMKDMAKDAAMVPIEQTIESNRRGIDMPTSSQAIQTTNYGGVNINIYADDYSNDPLQIAERINEILVNDMQRQEAVFG